MPHQIHAIQTDGGLRLDIAVESLRSVEHRICIMSIAILIGAVGQPPYLFNPSTEFLDAFLISGREKSLTTISGSSGGALRRPIALIRLHNLTLRIISVSVVVQGKTFVTENFEDCQLAPAISTVREPRRRS